MKKILFALLAITLVFVSCKKDDKKGDDTTGCTFTITVSDITSHEATVSIIPSVKDVPYYATAIPASELASYTDEQLTTEVYEFVEYYMSMYAQYGMTLYWANVTFTGDQPELTIDELDGGTAYTACAFQIDSVNKTNYPVSKQNFTTEEADPDEAYSYEPTTTTTFNFAPTEIEGTYYDSYSCFTMQIKDDNNTNTLFIGAAYTEGGEKTGTFPVSSDSEAAGVVWASTGYDSSEGTLAYSFVGVLTEEGYIDTENNPVYYITGGSMTISESSVTAAFTTKYGSTINLNFTGEVAWVNGEASAPQALRRAPKGPRMLRF